MEEKNNFYSTKQYQNEIKQQYQTTISKLRKESEKTFTNNYKQKD
jgi:hypothetical protein